MAEEVDSGFSKVTFGELAKELVVAKKDENLLQMLEVLLVRSTED